MNQSLRQQESERLKDGVKILQFDSRLYTSYAFLNSLEYLKNATYYNSLCCFDISLFSSCLPLNHWNTKKLPWRTRLKVNTACTPTSGELKTLMLHLQQNDCFINRELSFWQPETVDMKVFASRLMFLVATERSIPCSYFLLEIVCTSIEPMKTFHQDRRKRTG